MKDFIFGDLHGAFFAIDPILEEGGYVAGEDKVIFVGDYIDHNSNRNGESSEMRDARKTVQRVVDLKEESPENVFPLLGNHDYWMIEWLLDPISTRHPDPLWWNQGGKQTLESYGWRDSFNNFEDLKRNFPASHRAFFLTLDHYYIDGLVVAVHGGYPANIAAKKRVFQGILQGEKINPNYVQDMTWDREFWEGTALNRELFREVFGNRYMVVGHTKAKYHRASFSDPLLPRGYDIIPGPFVHPSDDRWVNIDSPGVHCLKIDEDGTSEILGKNGAWAE